MTANQQGGNLSRIINIKKSKQVNNSKIGASFQHLYDILSRKPTGIDMPELQYRSVPKARPKKDSIDSKLHINIKYENQTQKRNSQNGVNQHATKEHRGRNLNSMLELFYKQRCSCTPNDKRKAFQSQKTNQKLKNIILGKRKKKSYFCEYKNSFQQSSIPRLQKLPPAEQRLQFKRSATQNAQNQNQKYYQSISIKQTSESSTGKIKQQQIMNRLLQRHIKTQESSVNQKEGSNRYKINKNRKRLMIHGIHLANLLKLSCKTSELKQVIIKQLQLKQGFLEPLFFSPISQHENNINNKKQSSNVQNKRINKQQKQVVLGKQCPQLLVSQHIIWKLQKILHFYTFFLQSFRCEIEYLPPNQMARYNRRGNFYKYYIGHGNNRGLIIETMNKRWWWKEVSSIGSADFVWTQQKIIKLYNRTKNEKQIIKQIKRIQPIKQLCSSKQKQTAFSKKAKQCLLTQKQPIICSKQKQISPIKQKKQQVKIIYLDCDKIVKKMLTHSYKSKKNMKPSKLQMQVIQRPDTLLNHMIDGNILGDKKSLFNLLKLWKINYKKYDLSQLYKFIPQTFHLINLFHQQFNSFQQKFKNNQQQNNLWIVKPGQNSNRGRGIFLSNCFTQITESIRLRSDLGGTTIVQKYKSDLLLYKGRKFDIRTYLLCIVIGGNCKYFWYANGYIRTSSHLYNIKQLDSMIHLTNDAIQNKGDNYGKFQKGNKLSYSQLQTYINETFPKKQWKMDALVGKMKQIAKKVASSSYYLVDRQKKNHGFQLFGMDFIIDSQFNPWLLEVNTNPCLQLSSPLLQTLIPSLIQNVFRLAVDPLFLPNMLPDKDHQYSIPEKIIESNRFQLIFDSLIQKDVQWQRYCEQNWGKE